MKDRSSSAGGAGESGDWDLAREQELAADEYIETGDREALRRFLESVGEL